MAPIIIGFALIALEVLARVYSILKLRQHTRFRVSRWGVGPFLVYVSSLIVGLRAYYPRDGYLICLLVAGSVLFCTGWFVRYGHHLHRWAWKRARSVHLRRVLRFWLRLDFRVRHPGSLGACVELIGMAILWHSVAAFAVAALFSVAAWIAIELDERSIMRKKPDSGLDWVRKETPAMWPGFTESLWLLVGPTALGLLAAILARERVIFAGSNNGAISLLTTLTQVEATVGVLAITLVFVLVELTTGAYSPRLSLLLFKRRAFWFVSITFLLAIAYTLGIAAGAERWLPAEGIHNNLLVDISFVLAAIAVMALAVFIRDAASIVSPEGIMSDALKAFDADWMGIIRREWSQRFGPQTIYTGRDPMILVSDILTAALNRGDINSLRSGVLLLREQIVHVIKPDDVVVLDSYLHYSLKHLIRAAARRHEATWLLLLLYHLVEDIGGPSEVSLRAASLAPSDLPPGTALIREVADASIQNLLVEPASRALHLIQERGSAVVKYLPRAEDTSLYNPKYVPGELPQEQLRRLWENNWRIDNFQSGYIRYLGDKGTEAIEAGLTEVAGSASSSIVGLLGPIHKEVPDFPIRNRMILSGFWALDSICSAACRKRIHGVLFFATLDFLVREMDVQTDKVIAGHVSYYGSRFLLRMARAGILDMMTAEALGLAAVFMAERFPEPAISLIEAMGKAARELRSQPDFQDNENLMYAHAELVAKLEQTAERAHDEKRDKIRATVDEASKAAGKPLVRSY